MTVAAAVLAAGAGRRYAASGGGGHKLLAPWQGRPLVAWSVGHAVEAGLDQVLVVWGAVELTVALGLLADRVVLVHNPRWAQGQAVSLGCAIDACSGAGHDAVVVGLGDQPLVRADAWRAVAASPAPIAVATYAGVRGNPVKLDRGIWGLVGREGDEGARSLMRLRPDLVEEVPCPGDPADVDTVEDLRRWS